MTGVFAPFDVAVARHGTLGHVALSGEIDLAAVERLQRAVDRLGLESMTVLELDLTAVSFADSSALAWMSSCTAAQARGRSALTSSSAPARSDGSSSSPGLTACSG